MFNNTYLRYILIFLVIILLIALCIYNKNCFSLYKHKVVNSTNNKKSDNSFQDTLNNIISNTHTQINKACEEGYCEAFQSFTKNNTDTNTNTNTDTNTSTQTDIQSVDKGYLTSYIHKEDDIKVQLFYKTNCTYCKEFMPTWVKLINNLPNNATYEEINSENNNKLFSENNITTVPTIILLVNNENNINENNINKKKIYMGDRSYNDIKKFFKNNGVNLIQRNLEDFNNSSKYSDITDNKNNKDNKDNKNNKNPNCPSVSFDKQIDLEKDTYMYQIFNSDGQYGYAIGSNKNNVLTPYMAAFSTVDSYLSSLPDDKNNTKNSYKNLNECALLYADDIINFGLCDEEQLNNILDYQKNIESGSNIYRVDNTNYSTNNKVVSAIKKVCNM